MEKKLFEDRNSTRLPLVSIVIPAYSVAAFISETLASVFAQTVQDFEVILINDGSPDTPELETQIEAFRDRIIYVRQDNLGAGAARNAGLRASSGTYVAFLDGDDVYLPEFLKEQLSLITSHDGFDMVYADAENFGAADSNGLTNMQYNSSVGEVTAESLITGRCNVVTSAVVARRERVLNVGMFDESLRNSQDFDLWIRLAKDGARITYQHKVLVRRRIYSGSLASDPTNSFAGEIQVLHKTSQRADLSPREISALQATLRQRTADLEVIKAKRSLLSGDFHAARESFQSARENHGTFKLAIVTLVLRLAPKLLRRVYQMRTT